MNQSVPNVSVVIPTYNHADYIAEAIRSVLNQTHIDYELIVVNDGSTDHTSEVVKEFDDSRLRYLEQENRGATAARNTGIRASHGQYIALLDADDIWHPEKLQAHVEFLGQNPAIDATYNARFELNHSSNTIRALWRPPLSVTLSDLVLGFPFSPSDMVLRRKWVFQVGLFDEQYVFYGDDLDFFCRLALAGCRFARVDRALNYRRRHSGRIVKNLPSCVEAALRPLHMTFLDPRCPDEVLGLRDVAFANHFMFWINHALIQDETTLGQKLLLGAVRLDPSIIDGKPCRLLRALTSLSIVDDNRDHETLLRKLFHQLPAELSWLRESYGWAVARGYLLKGTRDIVWNRLKEGQTKLSTAAELGAPFDESFIEGLVKQLVDHESLLGSDATQQVLWNLVFSLEEVGYQAGVRKLQGCFSVNQAFRSYHAAEYDKVPGQVVKAIKNDPGYLVNRGVLAILVRSIGYLTRQSGAV